MGRQGNCSCAMCAPCSGRGKYRSMAPWASLGSVFCFLRPKIESMSLVLAVIAFSSASALITEFLQWALVWRTPGFVALKGNLAKHAAKVEEAKEGSASKKNLSKREARLENWRKEASRQVAQYNMKASFVVRSPTWF